ncbi:hypothetical protein V9K67_27110, partial [Paraflavisolibacter sp. H34]|uniref:hypothetical protein n=1 Tax=Huijunlia imazamoxiresistens TaxID=3127457 RepID=UPI00301A2FDC
HANEGIPYEPLTLRMPDGGFLNVKGMGDSTVPALNGSRIDYYRVHASDTASSCLGRPDSATSLWHFRYEPFRYNPIEAIHPSVFRESRAIRLSGWNFTTSTMPACEVVSLCDSLSLEISADTVCPGASLLLTVRKNRGCGSLVPLSWDTTRVSGVTRLSDSTYAVRFSRPGKAVIRGSLMGCTLLEDSVSVEVLPERSSLHLGGDTLLCTNTRILLNAGSGFASYAWQNGSTDSVFTVTAPGTY